MKQKFAALCAAVVLVAAIGAAQAEEFQPAYPQGKIIEHATMPSKILGKNVQYTVYLPPGYDTSKQTYPVLYLLHGGGIDDDSAMFQKGRLPLMMDRGLASGRYVPMIVVSPDGRRDEKNVPTCYYMNDADGKFRWADMFIEEFIPFFEKEYRVRQDERRRAIHGLSMGGYGALMFSFKYPDLFASTGTYSAGLYTPEQIIAFKPYDFERRYGAGFGAFGLEGEARLTEHYENNHPLALIKKVKIEDLKKLRIFMDCGAEDRFDEGNFRIHQHLRDNGIPHIFRLTTGGHTWPFHRKSMELGLEFASEVFMY